MTITTPIGSYKFHSWHLFFFSTPVAILKSNDHDENTNALFTYNNVGVLTAFEFHVYEYAQATICVIVGRYIKCTLYVYIMRVNIYTFYKYVAQYVYEEENKKWKLRAQFELLIKL